MIHSFCVSQGFCQLILGLAAFLSAAFESHRIIFNLFQVSKSVCLIFLVVARLCQLILGLAWFLTSFCQLILSLARCLSADLDLAKFVVAYFGSRKVFVSAFWVSQDFCSAYFE